jgi:hypothetical protein
MSAWVLFHFLEEENMSDKSTATAVAGQFQQSQTAYVEGSLTEFWKKHGVTPIPVTPCKEGEQGFSWSQFINGLARRTQGREDSNRE